MKKLPLIISLMFLLCLCIAASGSLRSAEAVTFEGIYLMGSTSMTDDGTRIYITDNIKTGSGRVRSSVRAFSVTGEVKELGSKTFQGEIKKVRYGGNKIFVHIGDSFFCCDVFVGEDSVEFGTETPLFVYNGLITFDVYGGYLYTLFTKDGSNYINVTSLTNLPSGGTTPEGTLAGVSDPVDICAQGSYLYILDKSGDVKMTVSEVDYVLTGINYGGNTPLRVLRTGSNAAVTDGTNLWILPAAVTGQIVEIPLSAQGMSLSIADAATIGGRRFFLDVSGASGRIDVKEFSFDSVSAVYTGVLLGNNAVMGDLPDFVLNTYSDCVSENYFELAYAVSYPSNVVYTVSDKNSELHLEGVTLNETDLLLLINRSADSDFVLILFNGKIGYIRNDAASLSIVNTRFVKQTETTRYSANQTFSVYSLPSTAARGHYLTAYYSDAIENPVRVSLLYTLSGYDGTEKWGYISYTDEGGVVRYGFSLLGDVRLPSNEESHYTIMRANPYYGSRLNVYAGAGMLAEVSVTVGSGEKVNVYDFVEGGRSYVSVTVDGKMYYGYADSDQLSAVGELTRNEALAIACALVILILIVACIFFVVYYKKHHKQSKEL